MNRVTARSWEQVTDSELKALDLLAFNGGVNPYGPGDNSVRNAFRMGKASLDRTVRVRTAFTGGRVLDLLSGFGRWLPSLATSNHEVIAIERLEGCTNIAKGICHKFGLDNVTLITADIEYLNKLEPESFDYVWMWSALQYVHRGWTLAQVNRLLKKDGRIYVSAYNSTGIMLQHVMDGLSAGKVHEGSSAWALSALDRGPDADECPNYCEPDLIHQVCFRYGLQVIAAAPEPALNLDLPGGVDREMEISRPFEHYYRTIEFVAEKEGNISGLKTYLLKYPLQSSTRLKIKIINYLNRIRKLLGKR